LGQRRSADRIIAVVEQNTPTDALGPNAWLVDEMYEQYLENPASVSESWRDFFADYQRDSDITESVRAQSLPATGRAGDTGQITAVKAGEKPQETPTKEKKPEPERTTGIAADGT